MLTRRPPRGFSLIELLVVLTVLALLLVALVPGLGSWGADNRVRTVGDTLQNALRLAQAEAIRRSRPAVLMLTDSSAPTLNATPAANGGRWVVRLLARDTDSDDEEDTLFVRGGTEPASLDVTVTGPALACFNALGQLVTLSASATGLGAACSAPDDGASPLSYTLFHDAAAHDLEVQVGLGGQVRLCDPGKTLSDSVPEGC